LRSPEYIPANRLANGGQKVLCLFCNGGECLENDVSVLGTNPQRPRSMVRFEVQPREVLVHEDVRYQTVLMAPMLLQGREICRLYILCATRLGQLACQRTEVDGGTTGYKSRLRGGRGDRIFLIVVDCYVLLVLIRSCAFCWIIRRSG
jgi:hypothetical protein